MFQSRLAAGYCGSAVQFTGPEEVAWVCGNALVLHSLKTGLQVSERGIGHEEL